jgi:hypothetical protein
MLHFGAHLSKAPATGEKSPVTGDIFKVDSVHSATPDQE